MRGATEAGGRSPHRRIGHRRPDERRSGRGIGVTAQATGDGGRGERVPIQVLRGIEGQLQRGELRLGDRLPGERILADRYGVSRASIREALQSLEVMGVLRSRTGSGPTAGTIVVADPSTALGSALRMHVASSTIPVGDVVEARLMIETWSAGELARRIGAGSAAPGAAATPPADGIVPGHAAAPSRAWSMPPQESVARLHHLVDAMSDRRDDRSAFLADDLDFHATIARGAGNAVVVVLIESLRRSIGWYLGERLPEGGRWRRLADRLIAEHVGIVASLERGDAASSAEAIRRHIDGFYASTLDL